MGVLRGTRKFIWIICLLLMTAGATAQAQSGTGEYHPEPFQDGKDVVWVPTAQALADKMLNLARVTPQDYVIDLGSGDGRLVITAAKRGARALGIEYNPDLVTLARRNAAREGVQDRATFLQGDLFESDFSEATVITMFLLQEINLKLRPKILELKPGTRIVSNTFDMGDWTPDETVYVSPDKGCDNNFCMGYFWIVPAKKWWRKSPMRSEAPSSSSKQSGGAMPSKSSRMKRQGQVKNFFSDVKDQVRLFSFSRNASLFSMTRLPSGTRKGSGAIRRFTVFWPNSVARNEKWGDGASPLDWS
jgi:SAM-dependent methyltransferase